VLLLAVVLVLALPWLPHVYSKLPVDDASDDARLIVWVLDWVRHALGTSPRALFDPPLNWPAPGQLAGSEHFLSSQLLFVPLRWLTGSSLAAANLTALLSYVLAVLCMDVLLVALGVEPWAAFVAAFAYGFGWIGRPGRLHILQSQHFYVPLVALALHRLRARPTPWRALCRRGARGRVAGRITWRSTPAWRAIKASPSPCAAGAGRYAGRAVGQGSSRSRSSSWCRCSPAAARGARRVELAYSRWKMSHLESEHEELANGDVLFLVRSYVGCALGTGQSQSCVPVDWLADRVWGLEKAGALPLFLLVAPIFVLIGFADAARTASRRRRMGAIRARRRAARGSRILRRWGRQHPVAAGADRGKPGPLHPGARSRARARLLRRRADAGVRDRGRARTPRPRTARRARHPAHGGDRLSFSAEPRGGRGDADAADGVGQTERWGARRCDISRTPRSV
jgi:hypothetical protein